MGRDYETKSVALLWRVGLELIVRRNFDYHSVQVAGAERIANVAAQSGVSRFVHLSHLNASHASPSKFYQAKAEGEDRVKAVFPGATIVRPAAMYGYEDRLLNNIACAFYDHFIVPQSWFCSSN